MNLGLPIIIIAFIFIWGFYNKKKSQSKKEIIEKTQTLETINEMEELFFEEVRSGKKRIKLTHIINEHDFMFIKTIFQEERIPYYMEEDKTLNIWPHRKARISGNINLHILEKDHDKVVEIIKNNRVELKCKLYII